MSIIYFKKTDFKFKKKSLQKTIRNCRNILCLLYFCFDHLATFTRTCTNNSVFMLLRSLFEDVNIYLKIRSADWNCWIFRMIKSYGKRINKSYWWYSGYVAISIITPDENGNLCYNYKLYEFEKYLVRYLRR